MIPHAFLCIFYWSCIWFNYVSVNIHCSCFGADLPHLGGGWRERPSVCWRHATGVCGGVGCEWGWGGGGVGVGLDLWYDIPNDMMLRDMFRHVIGIVDIVWPTGLDDNWPVHVWAPPAPTPTQPSVVWRLHYPPSGMARTEASWRPVMHRFKIYTGTWIPYIVHNVDRHTCTHLPAPPPSQSPESAEAPLSSPRKSRRQSWPTRSRASVQFNSASWYLWAYFIAKIMDYTRIWTIPWTCTHPPPRPTNPLRVRKLHFPPSREAGAEVCRHTTHGMVQIDKPHNMSMNLIYIYIQ